MRVLLTIVLVLFYGSPVFAQNQPKLEVGKVYAVVISCTTQYVPVGDKFQKVTDCYTEYWRILGVGKDGWVRFEDVERGVQWWGNINRVIAITPAIEKQVEAPNIEAT